MKGESSVHAKQLAVICLTLVLAFGLGACGSTQQAAKSQTSVGQAGLDQRNRVAPGNAETGEHRKEGAALLSKGNASPTAVVLKDIYFEFDKYLIDQKAGETLKQNAQWFRANTSSRLRIEGNCDERGTIEYNLALGQKRADAARSYLITLGVDGKKMEVVSYGKEKPVDPGNSEEAWAKNRRDHFVPLR